MNLTAQQAALAWVGKKGVQARKKSDPKAPWGDLETESNPGDWTPFVFRACEDYDFRLAPGETMEEVPIANDPATPVDDGGPAFPTPEVGLDIYDDAGKFKCCRVYPPSRGMSLRQHYAGLETLADWDNPEAVMNVGMAEALAGSTRPHPNNHIAYCEWEAKWRARLKAIRADALLAELRRKR